MREINLEVRKTGHYRKGKYLEVYYIYDAVREAYLWKDKCFRDIYPADNSWKTKEEAEEFLTDYLGRTEMSNYFMLDGKKIEMSDETAKNLRKQTKEETYAIGDIIVNNMGHKDRLLIFAGPERGEFGLVSLINTKCIGRGSLWYYRFAEANDTERITKKELSQLTGLDWTKEETE